MTFFLNVFGPTNEFEIDKKTLFRPYYTTLEKKNKSAQINFKKSKTDESIYKISGLIFTNFISNPLLYLKELFLSFYHVWIVKDSVNLRIKENSENIFYVSIKLSELIDKLKIPIEDIYEHLYIDTVYLIKEKAEEAAELMDDPHSTRMIINGNTRSITFDRFCNLDRENVRTLDLCSSNTTRFDFIGFDNIEELYIGNGQNITAEQFNEINKSKLKKLHLGKIDVTGFDFSTCSQLKELSLEATSHFTAEQFNSINVSST